MGDERREWREKFKVEEAKAAADADKARLKSSNERKLKGNQTQDLLRLQQEKESIEAKSAKLNIQLQTEKDSKKLLLNDFSTQKINEVFVLYINQLHLYMHYSMYAQVQ